MDKNIQALLQEIKTKTGWNQQRIAAELSISQPTVHRILRGQADCRGQTYRSIADLHESVHRRRKRSAS